MPLATTISSPASAASTASLNGRGGSRPIGVRRRGVGAVHIHVQHCSQGAGGAGQSQQEGQPGSHGAYAIICPATAVQNGIRQEVTPNNQNTSASGGGASVRPRSAALAR